MNLPYLLDPELGQLNLSHEYVPEVVLNTLELRSPDTGLWRQLATLGDLVESGTAPPGMRTMLLAQREPDAVVCVGTVTTAGEAGTDEDGRLESIFLNLTGGVVTEVGDFLREMREDRDAG